MTQLEKNSVWQGTLSLMVLRTLLTMGDQHGYGIARRIEQTSDGRLIGITAGAEERTRSASPELRVVLNWFEELKQRVPVK